MGVPGGPEKRDQTVPTGRVIKYPKKCALFCPPGGRPPGRPSGGVFPYRGNTPILATNKYGKGPKMALFGASCGARPRGPAGPPGRPPGGGENFPARARPGRRGPPGRGPRDGVSPRSYKQWPVRRGLPVLRASVCTASSRFGHLRDRSQVLRDPTRITRSEVERSKHTAGRELGGGLG